MNLEVDGASLILKTLRSCCTRVFAGAADLAGSTGECRHHQGAAQFFCLVSTATLSFRVYFGLQNSCPRFKSYLSYAFVVRQLPNNSICKYLFGRSPVAVYKALQWRCGNQRPPFQFQSTKEMDYQNYTSTDCSFDYCLYCHKGLQFSLRLYCFRVHF